jgi:hypothetical protein
MTKFKISSLGNQSTYVYQLVGTPSIGASSVTQGCDSRVYTELPEKGVPSHYPLLTTCNNKLIAFMTPIH